jgi:hypothetical protein
MFVRRLRRGFTEKTAGAFDMCLWQWKLASGHTQVRAGVWRMQPLVNTHAHQDSHESGCSQKAAGQLPSRLRGETIRPFDGERL